MSKCKCHRRKKKEKCDRVKVAATKEWDILYKKKKEWDI